MLILIILVYKYMMDSRRQATFLFLYQSAMASVDLVDHFSRFVVIHADGEEVPISFPLGNDGMVVITTIHFGLQFQLNIDSLYIDEEVFDLITRDLSHIVGQLLVGNGDGKH